MSDYLKDGAEIYRRSFATIRSEADLAGMEPALATVVVRMIHACGMVDLVADVAASPGFCAAARSALQAGKSILCDTSMVASGVTRSRLPAGNEVVCTLSDASVPALAAELGTTRTAAALELWAIAARGLRRGRRQRADGTLPPARADRAGRAAACGRDRRAGGLHRRGGVEGRAGRAPSGLEYLVVHGRRGGSAIAAAAVNALASDSE